jgi:hypothetical protein
MLDTSLYLAASARYSKGLWDEILTSMSNLVGGLESQGKYEDAEAMNRQTLALKETVLGREHPSTLTSLYCLAYILASRHRCDESVILYERHFVAVILQVPNQ